MVRLKTVLPALLLLLTNQLFAQGKAVITGKIAKPLSDVVSWSCVLTRLYLKRKACKLNCREIPFG
ncbi:hypothetical protein GCM10028895_34090 [Pontibacter rugosus]